MSGCCPGKQSQPFPPRECVARGRWLAVVVRLRGQAGAPERVRQRVLGAADTDQQPEMYPATAADILSTSQDGEGVVIDGNEVAQVDDDRGCSAGDDVCDGEMQAHRCVAVDPAVNIEFSDHPMQTVEIRAASIRLAKNRQIVHRTCTAAANGATPPQPTTGL